MRHLTNKGALRAILVVAALMAVVAAITPGRAVAAATPSGFLDLCKQAGPGVNPGQAFDFRVTLSGVRRIVTVPAGQCAELVVPREGSALSKGYFINHPDVVTRLLPASTQLVVDGTQLTAGQVQAILGGAPGVSFQSSLVLNLTQQLLAADLNVLRGVQPPAQVAQAIADADAGIAIIIGGQGQIQLASTLTKAQLSALVNTLAAFNEGKLKGPATPSAASLQIVESIPANIKITSIACTPTEMCSNADQDAGSVTAIVASGSTTTVTYTNRSTLGTLRLCKVAGAGISAGTPFTFDLGFGSVAQATVAAGECQNVGLFPEGTGQVVEKGAGAAGQVFAVTAIGCDPSARCTISSLAAGSVIVNLVGGSTTTVTYTNSGST